MRCAGLTWYKDNYGSILQAYALQTAVESFPDTQYELLQYAKTASNNTARLKRLLSKSPKYIAKRVWNQLTKPEIKQRHEACEWFLKNYIHKSNVIYNAETLKEANKVYDAFFCGSDQIWNPNICPVDDIYLLTFADENKKRVAYAPSIGEGTLPEEYAGRLKRELPKFTAVSCREESGTDAIKSLLGYEICQTVCDPTLLLDAEKWDEIIPRRLVKNDYVFCYFLGKGKEIRKHAEEFAAKTGCPIVTIPCSDAQNIEPYDKEFGNIRLGNVSPADFLCLIKNAKYVLTDSFHCCVFSTLFHIPYFAYQKGVVGQSGRIPALQRNTGMKEWFVNEHTDYDAMLATEFDWAEADSRVSAMRAQSMEYLKNTLKGEEKCG